MANIDGLHLITDTALQARFSHQELALAALEAGVRVIQYRRKEGSTRAMVEEARALAALCNRYGALFIVNDRLDVALAAGAHGLHLGQADLPLAVARRYMGSRAIIGASTADLEQLAEAARQGASYVGYGPVFTTNSKADASQVKGLKQLAGFSDAAKSYAMPVVALGGIETSNIGQVKKAGASAVAVIGAICRAETPGRASLELLEAWRAA